MTAIKTAFNYLDNSKAIKKKHFNTLMRRLNKPLFSVKELEEMRNNN